MNDSGELRDFWKNQYASDKTHWDRGEVHPAMLDWIECGDLSPCQIVVPGCGRGYEVIHLSRLGFDVTGIDYVAAPIEFLRSQLDSSELSATLVQTDLFSFEASHSFDAVYEQTCLCAIEPDLHQRYADLLFNWLRPGGKLFLLMMQSDFEQGPPFNCDPEEMKKLFPADRWQWQPAKMKDYPHPSGRIYEFASLLIRK